MSHKSLGNGIALDEQFDFTIDTSGDIKSSSGLNELEKDLSFSSTFQLRDYIGSPLTPTTRQEVENALTEVFEIEPRIDSVHEIKIEQVKKGFDVQIRAVVDGEQEALIFPVGEHR